LDTEFSVLPKRADLVLFVNGLPPELEAITNRTALSEEELDQSIDDILQADTPEQVEQKVNEQLAKTNEEQKKEIQQQAKYRSVALKLAAEKGTRVSYLTEVISTILRILRI
jgi:hypothetical protein